MFEYTQFWNIGKNASATVVKRNITKTTIHISEDKTMVMRMAAISALVATLAMSSVIGHFGGHSLQLAAMDTTTMLGSAEQ